MRPLLPGIVFSFHLPILCKWMCCLWYTNAPPTVASVWFIDLSWQVIFFFALVCANFPYVDFRKYTISLNISMYVNVAPHFVASPACRIFSVVSLHVPFNMVYAWQNWCGNIQFIYVHILQCVWVLFPCDFMQSFPHDVSLFPRRFVFFALVLLYFVIQLEFKKQIAVVFLAVSACKIKG